MRPLALAVALLSCGLVASIPTSVHAQSAQDRAFTSQDIESGSRLYASQCAQCHGPNGDTVAGINLRRGQFRKPMSDDDLRRTITAGVPGSGMPPFALQPAELDGLVAFVRAGFDVGGTALKVGDAARGRALFEGKGACTTCHRVNGSGSRVAPDLSDIGAIRALAQLYRSLTDPASQTMPINREVRIETRYGRTFLGRRLNEDTYTVQLIDERERLVSLDKNDIRRFEVMKVSPMPSASKTLSTDEVSDLLGFLLSLKGLP